jgi:hypothetical protein
MVAWFSRQKNNSTADTSTVLILPAIALPSNNVTNLSNSRLQPYWPGHIHTETRCISTVLTVPLAIRYFDGILSQPRGIDPESRKTLPQPDKIGKDSDKPSERESLFRLASAPVQNVMVLWLDGPSDRRTIVQLSAIVSTEGVYYDQGDLQTRKTDSSQPFSRPILRIMSESRANRKLRFGRV